MKLENQPVIAALGCAIALGACGGDDKGRDTGFTSGSGASITATGASGASTDGGSGDGGSGDGGSGDGGSGDGGSADDGTAGDGGSADGGETAGSADGGSADDGGTSGSGTSGGATATNTGGGTSDDGGIKFDVGTMIDVPPNPTTTGSDQGCQKIDFLFVIDNSGSMSEEQQALVASFPGFINSIRNTVMAQDYRILTIDTDAGGGGGCFSSTCCSANCATWCPTCMAGGCNCVCNNVACAPPPGGTDCDTILGSGKTKDQNSNDCGITGGNRYMLDTQPALDTTFSCVALVGTSGDGNERPMEAMVESVTTQNQVGECNEGFVRNDALLVVTFITDEEDNGKSAGNPTTWKNDLIQVKGGDPDAVVMLGLVGDDDVPGGYCAMAGNAQASPNLRNFADSFNFGSWGSVCEPNYTPFFDAAVSVVDTACDTFEPPG